MNRGRCQRYLSRISRQALAGDGTTLALVILTLIIMLVDFIYRQGFDYICPTAITPLLNTRAMMPAAPGFAAFAGFAQGVPGTNALMLPAQLFRHRADAFLTAAACLTPRSLAWPVS